ncbi:uncharacterized protein LOC125488446 isoform X2 [Plutella xylostella]|uniref:uncharacterized protein LOC125488446 isoform X2 n=1 Tax=Plutella xylostella TaxID=51655 RepID=UPI00203224D4|nr:uncharacterized protein LOC125488446 isoform X2 [Plutella xylostella]
MSDSQCDLRLKQELETPEIAREKVNEIPLDNLCRAIDTAVHSDIESDDGTVVIKQEDRSSDDDDDDDDDDDRTQDPQNEQDVPLLKTATKRPSSLISTGIENIVTTEDLKKKRKRGKRGGKKLNKNRKRCVAVWPQLVKSQFEQSQGVTPQGHSDQNFAVNMSDNQCDLQLKQELETPEKVNEISLDNLCRAIDTAVQSDIDSDDGTVVIKQEDRSSDDDQYDDDDRTRDPQNEQDVSLPKTATKRPSSLISTGIENNVATEGLKAKRRRIKRGGNKLNKECCVAVWNFPPIWTEAEIITSISDAFPNTDLVSFEVLDHGSSNVKVAYMRFNSKEESKEAYLNFRFGAEADGQELHVRRGKPTLRNKIVKGKLFLETKSEDTTTARLSEDESDENTSDDDDDRRSKDIWDEDPSGTYGLSQEYLNAIKVKPPLTQWVHISNFSCTAPRLKHILSLAGRVLICDIKKSNITTKFQVAKAKFSHPIEAAQAVSMFNGTHLDGRALSVVIDRSSSSIKELLPAGITKLGPGFGINGEPEADIVRKCQRYFQGKKVDINPQLFSANQDLRCDNPTRTMVQDDNNMRTVNAYIKDLIDKDIKIDSIINALKSIETPNVVGGNSNINEVTNVGHGSASPQTQDCNNTTPNTPQVQIDNSTLQSKSHQTTILSANNVSIKFTPRMGNNRAVTNDNIPAPLQGNVVSPNIIRHDTNRMQTPEWSETGENVIRPEHEVVSRHNIEHPIKQEIIDIKQEIIDPETNMDGPENGGTPPVLNMTGSSCIDK